MYSVRIRIQMGAAHQEREQAQFLGKQEAVRFAESMSRQVRLLVVVVRTPSEVEVARFGEKAPK